VEPESDEGASSKEPSAWLLMAVGDDRQHGGNDGYDDDPDVYYSWDSTVPNHASIHVGDYIAVWDKHRLLGASVVEAIELGEANKILYKCVHCGLAGIKPRRTKSPRFKCYKCGGVFDNPDTRVVRVTTYRSRHDAGWVDMNGLLSASTLRSLCESPESQLSLRSLRWAPFLSAAQLADGRLDLVALWARATSASTAHRRATVRVRVGQRSFRDSLLRQFGPVCALTGPAPVEVLEAGHLYSYADIGFHHQHGGLLLRRDVQTLFDRGAIAMNPDSRAISVSASLADYPHYADLDGQEAKVELTAGHLDWLRKHWAQHR
jgi:hypothetical protein